MRIAVALLILAGCLSPAPPVQDEAPVPEPDAALLAHLQTLDNGTRVLLETSHGDIMLLFYDEWMPITTRHILALVERGFYDGLVFHRVVDDFVIQGGDPTGTGEGGSGPGGSSDMIPLEIHEGLQFGSGAVGLARWTDDTGDSQFFITEKPAPHLHDPQGRTGDVFGAYALFAQVVDGMEVVRSIAAVPIIPGLDRPVTDVPMQASIAEGPVVDPLNAVVDVLEPFDAWYARGAALETPRFAVVGHPIMVRLHAVPGEDGCPASAGDGNHWVSPGAEPDAEPVAFEATSDPCTFEAALEADRPGLWRFIGHDAPREGVPYDVTIDVLADHAAYAPYLGP